MGEPTEKLVAVRLPMALFHSASRYADLYHTSVSALLREGLETRLHGAPHTPSYNGITSLASPVVVMVERLATHLRAAAEELRKACQEGEEQRSEAEVEDERYNGITESGAAITALPDTPKRQPEKTMSAYDVTKYVLGKLCPRRHDYQGSGQSLLRRSNRHCILCDREKFHERKQAKRHANTAASVGEEENTDGPATS